MITKRFKPELPGSRSLVEHRGLFSFVNLAIFKARVPSVLVATLVLYACASNPYQPQIENLAAVKARSESQTIGNVRVSVAVPGPVETEAIFNLPLYDRGVQPVWIEVDNRGDTDLRYAPVGTDPEYIPPFEVAYTNKAGFSTAAHKEMERYLHSNTMPRTVKSGEARSGFIFTQARPGTKGINIDLFGPKADDIYSFVFFIPVPGFVADHAQVNFKALYNPGDMVTYDLPGLRKALAALPCCSRDQSGVREGDPLNLILVGNGDDILQSLLRAGWFERIATERGNASAAEAGYLYGRTADAVFRKSRPGKGTRSELHLWMTPMRVGEQPVWAGDVVHFLGSFGGPIRPDPNIDDARDFFFQDLWYSQGLARFAWVRGANVAPIDRPKQDIMGNEYFTDGYRAVLWPSGNPASLLETDYLSWDSPPKRRYREPQSEQTE